MFVSEPRHELPELGAVGVALRVVQLARVALENLEITLLVGNLLGAVERAEVSLCTVNGAVEEVLEAPVGQ